MLSNKVPFSKGQRVTNQVLSPDHTSCERECEASFGDAIIGTHPFSNCDAMVFASHQAFARSMNQALSPVHIRLIYTKYLWCPHLDYLT